MPNQTLTILKISLASLGTVYLALIITTVSFAAWQSDLALAARDAESSIATLEARYYKQVGVLSATDPASMNLHKPVAVKYATRQAAPTVSLR